MEKIGNREGKRPAGTHQLQGKEGKKKGKRSNYVRRRKMKRTELGGKKKNRKMTKSFHD